MVMVNIELELGIFLQWEEQIKASMVPTSWEKKRKKSDAMWHEHCSMSVYIQSSYHTKHDVAIWNMNLQVVLNHWFQDKQNKTKNPQKRHWDLSIHWEISSQLLKSL